MKDNTIKTAICGLIISAFAIAIVVPKVSLAIDMILFVGLLISFTYMLILRKIN